MQNLLWQLEKKKSWKSFLKTQCRRNSVNPILANSFTVIKFRKFFDEKPKHIEIPDRSRRKSLVWLENQLKAYQWFLIVMSGCRETLIQNFTEDQWEELSDIFEKEASILQYEAVRLIRERKNTKRKWNNEESEFLERIINEDFDNKWSEVARKLFQLSHRKYFRSGKQCREQWLNHLDPKKKHGDWLASEDLTIVQFIKYRGKKWAQIARQLKNARTEHMIKNRFKTIMIRLKKRYEHIKSQNELLQLKIKEIKDVNPGMANTGPENQQLDSKKEFQKPDFEGLPILDSDQDEESMNAQNNQNNERTSTGGFKQFQFQQVVTPCANIYQIFTPNFLNTPHAMPFLHANFGFAKNDNLFLRNN